MVKRPLLRRDITYSSAKCSSILTKRIPFFASIEDRRDWIKAVVAAHLNIKPSSCDVADPKEWIHGSFNLCVPVKLRGWTARKQPGSRVLFRLPLPYKVGEAFNPGNVDEKIRCEAGTYAWLEETHPQIPIPRLYGFSLSSGDSVYTGQMLSDTWYDKSNDLKLRKTLYRDLARILLNLSRVPLPRIGSFTIDSRGFLSLTNRPLTSMIQDLENEEIPTNIHRDYTYLTTDSYIVDTLDVHNSRFLNQPNAINDKSDGLNQMTALTGMRAAFPLFFQRNLRRGPFVLSLTDLHQSNIFVDDNWHITSLIDLEWACSLPNEEETILANSGESRLSTTMQRGWELGTFWFSLALRSPIGLFRIFDEGLLHRLGGKHFDDEDYCHVMVWHWARDIGRILTRKMEHKKQYDDELRLFFNDGQLG
ncbi:predicted protein [Uncinocarpus reesii 1704]|uniref:Aminoglycoside phosphotransferase domain-containing protein n=1 Tax=Uncinocarpus reesii (strain UAMH 1704) TaxID=336963 RepID=C4JRQ1_UNCRE|nr:uncharacterized protein UREG_05140 [Uncinocarpus reesii 1704]EEP80298.1 predicted protein [Uncinocarpus reesii 1704]